MYNFLLVTLYLFCLETINHIDETVGQTVNIELIADFRVYERDLYGKLDPSIRFYLQKRGISIREHINVGFDTEFTKSGPETNCLVSAQLAISTKSYLLIPRIEPYKLSTIDEQTNKLTPIGRLSGDLNYSKLETSIQCCIESIRRIKYFKNDTGMLILTESLRLIKGLSYFDHDCYTVFSLPRSVIQPYIKYGNEFSFKELLEISSTIAQPYLVESNRVLLDLITSFSSNQIDLSEGKERMLEDVTRIYGEYQEIEQIGGSEVLKPLTQIQPFENELKRVERKYLSN